MQLVNEKIDNGCFQGICLEQSQTPWIMHELQIRLLYTANHHLSTGVWNHPWLANNFWRLYVNDAFGGTLISDNVRIDLSPHTIYLIPSGSQFSCCNTNDMNQFFVHFDILGIHPFLISDLFPGPVPVDANNNLVGLANDVCKRITGKADADISLFCQIKALVYQALGNYLLSIDQELLVSRWKRYKLIQPVATAMHMIEGRLERPYSNRQLADACLMSQNHFIRCFRNAVGQTPQSFVQQKRFARAAQLLMHTNDSIDSIARNTGFNDRFYFTRAFHRAMGAPPASYRRSMPE